MVTVSAAIADGWVPGETLFEIEPPLAILTFNRPKARNAMTWGMYQALLAACETVNREEAVQVLVLRGAGGRAFSAGTDISQFQAFTTPEDSLQYERRVSEVLETLAAVFREHGAKGRGRVSLVLDADAREVELELGATYAISPAMRGAIKSIPGIVDVQDL